MDSEISASQHETLRALPSKSKISRSPRGSLKSKYDSSIVQHIRVRKKIRAEKISSDVYEGKVYFLALKKYPKETYILALKYHDRSQNVTVNMFG